LAAATPLPEPAVEAVVDEVGDDEEVDDDEELLELPHALRAVAATTSRTRSGERRRIMPRLSRKRPRTGRTARWAGPVQHVASGEERLPVRDHARAEEAPCDRRGPTLLPWLRRRQGQSRSGRHCSTSSARFRTSAIRFCSSNREEILGVLRAYGLATKAVVTPRDDLGATASTRSKSVTPGACL
jgi:hypothetical protein